MNGVIVRYHTTYLVKMTIFTKTLFYELNLYAVLRTKDYKCQAWEMVREKYLFLPEEKPY